MMRGLNPMLAQTGDEPEDSPNHIYDLKYNGMRIVGEVENDSALLIGRSGADYTAQFPELHDLHKHLKVKRAQIDGEVVCLGEDGLPDFNALQNRYGKRDPLAIQAMMKRFPAIYQVFEVAIADDWDLTTGSSSEANQMQRREILEKILVPDESIRLSPFVDGKGIALFEEVKGINERAGRQVFDGIMAKTKTGLYYPGLRSPDWKKLKFPHFANFVICGYTHGTGWREDMMGAIVLGKPESGQLRWVGCAGSGFTVRVLEDLYEALLRIQTEESPFPPDTKVPKLRSWVRPMLVAEVKFYDVTKDGQLIWPIFQRVRTDLGPDDLKGGEGWKE